MLQDRSFFLDQKNDLIKNKLFFTEDLPVKDLLKQVIENFMGKSKKFKQYLKESIDQINDPNFSLNDILECISNLNHHHQQLDYCNS